MQITTGHITNHCTCQARCPRKPSQFVSFKCNPHGALARAFKSAACR